MRAKVGHEHRCGTEIEPQRSGRLIQRPPQLIPYRSVQQKFANGCFFQRETDRSHNHHLGDGDRKEDGSRSLRHHFHSQQWNANRSADENAYASVKRGGNESGNVTPLTLSVLQTHRFVGDYDIGPQTQWNQQGDAAANATTVPQASSQMTRWLGKCLLFCSISALFTNNSGSGHFEFARTNNPSLSIITATRKVIHQKF